MHIFLKKRIQLLEELWETHAALLWRSNSYVVSKENKSDMLNICHLALPDRASGISKQNGNWSSAGSTDA